MIQTRVHLIESCVLAIVPSGSRANSIYLLNVNTSDINMITWYSKVAKYQSQPTIYICTMILSHAALSLTSVVFLLGKNSVDHNLKQYNHQFVYSATSKLCLFFILITLDWSFMSYLSHSMTIMALQIAQSLVVYNSSVHSFHTVFTECPKIVPILF